MYLYIPSRLKSFVCTQQLLEAIKIKSGGGARRREKPGN